MLRQAVFRLSARSARFFLLFPRSSPLFHRAGGPPSAGGRVVQKRTLGQDDRRNDQCDHRQDIGARRPEGIGGNRRDVPDLRILNPASFHNGATGYTEENIPFSVCVASMRSSRSATVVSGDYEQSVIQKRLVFKRVIYLADQSVHSGNCR